jgi:DNA-binding MarR family transcriptional regulator
MRVSDRSARGLRLYHRLQVTAHRLKKRADRRLLQRPGLTTAQVALLVVVEARGSLTQRAAAEELGLVESAVTALVGRLVDQGLLARRRDPDDGRAWALRPTASGRRALERAGSRFEEVNRRIDDALTAAERAQLAAMLDRLSVAFRDDTRETAAERAPEEARGDPDERGRDG